MSSDEWSRWLLTRRDGPDPARHTPALTAFRDGVLDRAALRPDDVLLDVGAGTGLIGLAALDRLGPHGRVVFSDVSAPLLDECRSRAGGDPRCSFVRAAADDLAAIGDATVDVVTTRSVLLYVRDRPAAFAEFRRVLRPGGRLSIFEPVNSFAARHRPADLFGLAESAVAHLTAKILAAFPDPETMLDFDERDLLGWAAAAGFRSIELDYRAQLDVPAEPFDWAALRDTAPNPLAPTYAEAMAAALTPAEQTELEEFLLARSGEPGRRTIATVFLRAAV